MGDQGERMTTQTSPTPRSNDRGRLCGVKQVGRDVREQGFTLIELLVVMTIIAIGFFALRPSFAAALRGAEQRRALGQVVALLAGVRNQAIVRGRLARVICDAEQGAFWAELQADPGADPSQFNLLPVLGRERVVLPEGLSLGEVEVAGQGTTILPQRVIYFYPDGGTDGARLTLRNAAGAQITVELATATGRVYVNA